jgi:hypothetical protein
MLSSNSKILITLLCLSLVGCLDSKDKKSEQGSADVDSSSEIMMSSVSSDKNCNPSRQGTIVYDADQANFFVCVGTSWLPVQLNATKGDKGDKGDTGAAGAAGTNGAAGAQGPAGTNGRDGMDGDGIRLALKENGQVKGILIQYAMEGSNQLALMMLPSGDQIYINANTGVFQGKPMGVYYTQSGCTGTAYAGRSDWGAPHVVGRIYVGPINNEGAPIAFYRAVAPNTMPVQTLSYRDYGTYGHMHECVERENNQAHLMRVEEIPYMQSLQNLAPIRFTP